MNKPITLQEFVCNSWSKRSVRIMKISLILCLMALQITASNVYSQYVNLKLSVKNTTVAAVISSITHQTGYEFSYDAELLNKQIKNVSVSAKNEHIENVLTQLFKDTGIGFKILDNRVFLIENFEKNKTSENKTAEVQQKQKTVTGTILDQSGVPVIGANVVVKGSSVGTITDLDGNFTLSNVPDGASLLVSYIGFLEQTILVTNKISFNITLKEDTQKLDEVVVVGYGTQKKVNLTGSITNVKTDELSSIATSNLSNTLAGRAPGMTITGNSGLMGSSSEIRMRGGFGDPLFVIDGVIRDKASFDALQPNEIDQLSFLKDAATASIYGSSAGNGVVLVTTKTGSKDSKPVFDYQGSYSFSKPTKTLFSDMFTATDELTYQNRVAEFQGLAIPNGDDEFEYFKDRSYNVNDYIWQNPWNTKHSLSVSGGNEDVQYYVLGSYLGEEGSYVNLKNQKFSLRSNLTTKLSKYLTMNLNLSAYQSDDKRFFWPYSDDDEFGVYDLYRCTFNALKTIPFYANADGTPSTTRTDYPIYPAIGSWQSWNVVDQVIGDRYIKTRKRNMNAILSFNADLSFLLPGLSTKVLANYIGNDYTRKKYMTHQKNYKFQQADPKGNRFLPGPIDEDQVNIFTFGNAYENLQYGMNTLWSEQFNWFLNYNHSFGKHDVAATVVFEQSSNGGEYVYAKADNPLTSYDQMFVYSTDAEMRTGDASEETGGRLSWIGRFNYSYAQKYIAEFSFRYDGNTLFAKDQRWGFFPSVSAAWRLSQEDFMENTSDWLSDLKIRASYGTTGNDLDVYGNKITPFSYIEKYVSGSSYIYGDALANGIAPGDVPNPYLTWATSTTYNGGLDFGFLNNRLSGTLDVFYRKEKDILGTRVVTLPSTYGQSLAPENYAARSWRGGEMSLMWRDQAANGKIKYSLYANVGYSKDQWDVLDQSAVYTTGNLSYLSQIGMADSRVVGYKAVDIIRTQEQVDALKSSGFKQWGRDPYLGGILYEDTHSDGYVVGPDGKVDSNDSYNLLSDNATPRINYGFGGSLNFKGITLDLHFQGVGGYDRFMGGPSGGFYQYGSTTRPYYPIWTSDDCWRTDNVDGKYPRVIGKSWYESGAGSSTFWKRNGAYLRLKNVNLGYDLPANLLRPLGLTKVQVFMNATNLFSISAVKEFMDPEQEYYDSYPLMKTFTFGLNFTF